MPFPAKILLCAILLILWLTPGVCAQIADGEGRISDDQLRLEDISWAGNNATWGYRQPLNILNLAGRPYGKVIIDRDGKYESPCSLLGCPNPFDAPTPGKKVVLTLWGSKADGCFAYLVVHTAPLRSLQAVELQPRLLEVAIGDNVYEISPAASQPPRLRSSAYQYTEYINGNAYSRSSTWYGAIVPLSLTTAVMEAMRSAAPAELKARITYLNNNIDNFKIGPDTVRHWKSAFSYNPACLAATR